MPEYTPDEMKDWIKRGGKLAEQIETLIKLQPKDTVTMGVVIQATAHLFATRATDRDHAQKLAQDVSAAIFALFDMRIEK
jgi:hypothetical protein